MFGQKDTKLFLNCGKPPISTQTVATAIYIFIFIIDETTREYNEIATEAGLITSERTGSWPLMPQGALAIAICGATLVAAWRDGGAAKRTRL